MRSCQICHQRKVRCDKKSPCSNCVRANVLCHYPVPERRPRRFQKTTIIDVAARLEMLERRVAVIPTANNGAAVAVQSNEDDESMAGDEIAASSSKDVVMDEEQEMHTERNTSPEELLMQDGDSSCFFNEVLLSRILDEERELQSAMGTPKDGSIYTPNMASFDIGAPLSEFRKAPSDEQSHHPSRRHAVQLWRAYINNVDPICKILHIPTMEASVFGAAKDPTSIQHDLSALLFAIYFASVASLTSNDVANILGQPKGAALCEFKQGLEQSLAAANFLDTPSLRSIQAMAIYLYSLRICNLGRSTWTLYGLLMRSAQSIGLHRDGIYFKLSPFKTEMRRRLWWFLSTAEHRAGEDHGISVSYPMGSSSDTRLPSNLNDSDLTPNMTELPAPKSTWTTMTFSLVVFATTLRFHQLYRSSASSSDGNSTTAASEVQSSESHLMYIQETYLKHCNPEIPAQLITIIMGQHLPAKAEFVFQQQALKRTHNSTSAAFNAKEEFLIKACEILETNIQLQTEDLLEDFRWIVATYTPYTPLTYILWHLLVKPTGPNVERAWSAVDRTFEMINRRDSFTTGEMKWKIVQILKRKACMRMRDHVGHQETTFAGGENTTALCGLPVAVHEGPDALFRDIDFLNVNATDFADWSNLVNNVDLYGFEN